LLCWAEFNTYFHGVVVNAILACPGPDFRDLLAVIGALATGWAASLALGIYKVLSVSANAVFWRTYLTIHLAFDAAVFLLVTAG
jgi:xanthine/uracil permease